MKNPRQLRDPVSILTAARDRIANGFVKNRLYQKRKNGMAFCSLGAIRSVSRSYEHEHKASEALRLYGLNGLCVVRFNDDPMTRKRDVVRAFNKTIKALTA